MYIIIELNLNIKKDLKTGLFFTNTLSISYA